jgi:transcriptional regulator with XRE-family HTH domain
MADDVSVGRQVQAVRLSKNLSQSVIAERAGVSRNTISRLELGQLDGMTVGTVRAISRALVMPSLVTLGWRGPEVDRLTDRVHAAMVEEVAAHLERFGWEIAPENSFNHYGERGAVDVLAWHAAGRALLVVETKSRVWDLQDTLSAIDRKRRLLPELAARRFGWRSDLLGVLLVMPETRAHRRLIERHQATFRAAFPDRQLRVKGWLECPDGNVRGLWFLSISHQAGTRQRSRRKRARSGGPKGSIAGRDRRIAPDPAVCAPAAQPIGTVTPPASAVPDRLPV